MKKIPARFNMYCPLTNEYVDIETGESIDAD